MALGLMLYAGLYFLIRSYLTTAKYDLERVLSVVGVIFSLASLLLYLYGGITTNFLPVEREFFKTLRGLICLL